MCNYCDHIIESWQTKELDSLMDEYTKGDEVIIGDNIWSPLNELIKITHGAFEVHTSCPKCGKWNSSLCLIENSEIYEIVKLTAESKQSSSIIRECPIHGDIETIEISRNAKE